MSIIIRDIVLAANCVNCEWRDAEACGECELMIGNSFLTYEDQYAHCPFNVIAARYQVVELPPHGDLIDRKDAYDSLLEGMVMTGYQSRALDCIHEFYVPTIIEAEGEE